MSRFFLKLLGFILLVSTVGLVTCQSVVKASTPDQSTPTQAYRS